MKSSPLKIKLNETQKQATERWLASTFADDLGWERPSVVGEILHCSPMSLQLLLMYADTSAGDLEPYRLKRLGVEAAKRSLSRLKSETSRTRREEEIRFLECVRIGSGTRSTRLSREESTARAMKHGLNRAR